MSEHVIDLSDGVAMVVTDLHGRWDVYVSLRDRFLDMFERGEAHRLIFCGDLIHADKPGDPDDSLDLLLDVMRLQRELGPECVVMLLGNHEMPHIYGVTLAKGEMNYTPPFEAALAQRERDGHPGLHTQVVAFLASLPFYARTRAGVTLSHAGAPPNLTHPDALQHLLALDHCALLEQVDNRLAGFGVDEARRNYEKITRIPYQRQAQELLAVTGPQDPRYNHLLRGVIISNSSPDFELLWDTLFTLNELDAGVEQYLETVEAFLHALSAISPCEQRVLVAGHLGVRGGCAEVGQQQLRLASYTHARPRESGRYLLLDCARPVHTAVELLRMTRRTME